MKKNLGYVITAASAVIFVNVLLPLLDDVVSLAGNACNKLFNKWQCDMEMDVAEHQAATELVAPKPDTCAAIGFDYTSDDCEEYDD